MILAAAAIIGHEQGADEARRILELAILVQEEAA